MKEAYDYCQTLVRQRDRERFLSTLFAPAGKRLHLFALYAFDLEIARVPDAVREPMAGEVRLQWWREALAGDRVEEANANPVSSALLETIKRCDIPAGLLAGMIDARQFDLVGQPMESREALRNYLDAVFGAPIALAARILDPKWKADEAAKLAGQVVGVGYILRDIARDIADGRLFLPLDVLAAHDVHTASVVQGENTAGLRAALAELRDDAQTQLAELRARDIPQTVLPAFLSATLTPLYLARMERKGYDPFRSDVSVSGFRTQFALWRAARSGKI